MKGNDSEVSNLIVFMYISEATMEISEEFLVYDEESLLGDMGGMVGMLMGVSILTMYEAVYNFVKHIARKLPILTGKERMHTTNI